ncbi:hypothetical protein [Luteimonas kalidii]|uniref:Dicarboxylate transport domain-containing protein n=1 Tax=Luteimonas kalidii TaxID=3042025 RepID=A0ABT6JXX1_9GAMM|nr:hypothetical protein [Luteimonas kalidii]MDH5834771.1 hypothetical protein [Luteimonas kalidii]
MPARILTLLLLMLCAWPAQARTATARIDTIRASGAELHGVTVHLDWPAGAARGTLRIEAARIEADALGYRFRDVRWTCPLASAESARWSCSGPLRAAGAGDMQLAVDLSSVRTDGTLARGDARISLQRTAASPDATRLQLTRVPVAWAQALLSSAWSGGRLGTGEADGRVTLHTPRDRPVRVDGDLAIRAMSLESADASIAVGDLDGRIGFAAQVPDTGATQVSVDGELRDGEILFGSTYLALEGRPLQFALDARQAEGGGWAIPRLQWRDGPTLAMDGSAALAADGGVRELALEARSTMLDALPARYLSGWLGLAGLGELALSGAATVRVEFAQGALHTLDAALDGVDLVDAAGRFRIDGLAGDLRLATDGVADSELRWRGGALYDLAFGAIRLPMRSADAALRLREPASLAMLGGQVRLPEFTLQPPAPDAGMRVDFGLELDALDLGQLTTALGWPAFAGTLSGRIPSARYADERLDFEGGLAVEVFGGRVDVGALSMERPFGVAPTLSADLALRDLDLLGITGAFDFGSITGRLHGRVDGLRLVDWTATAFDAELHTEPARGVRQRISQRAVQDISSVGDASLVSSLQGRLIALFDDFGYRRIGIGCRLANEVCRMSGLHSAGDGFTIVEGAGVPKLQVVGFNRNVDWPTLVERLAAVAAGDVAPVVE